MIRKLKHIYELNHVNVKKVVLIYQMGKVGSSSICATIQNQTNITPYNVHRMLPKNIANVKNEYLNKNLTPPNDSIGEILYRQIINTNQTIRIISLVRNPIERNISAFFQNLIDYYPNIDYKNPPQTEELMKAFTKDYPQESSVNWFDDEFIPTTNINIYEHKFNKSKKFTHIDNKNYKVLIMRSDLSDSKKTSIVNNFLETKISSVSREHQSLEKPYHSTYKKFISHARFPKKYVDKMINSKYSTHFFTKEEQSTWRKKWQQ